jgi:hypothetical protein
VFGMTQSRLSRLAALALALSTVGACLGLSGAEPTVEELKDRVGKAAIGDRPPLCIRISELQLDATDRFYVADDDEKVRAALGDVVTYSEMARDYSIQSLKHEKQSEIAVRKMVRRLVDLKHTVSREDQEQIQNTIDRLQRVRDDLLAAMFAKGNKK